MVSHTSLRPLTPSVGRILFATLCRCNIWGYGVTSTCPYEYADVYRIIFSVPLCYVYPAMLHYKACARTRRQKLADIALIVFGMVAAVYTTMQTVRVRVLDYFVGVGTLLNPLCDS